MVLMVMVARPAWAQSIAIEAHAGDRPDDADRLLAPVYDALGGHGYRVGVEGVGKPLEETVSRPGRVVILDPDAEANALGLSVFLKANERGDQQGVKEGVLGHLLGADWYMDQNVVTHSAGTGTAETTHLVVGAFATGASGTVALAASFSFPSRTA